MTNSGVVLVLALVLLAVPPRAPRLPRERSGTPEMVPLANRQTSQPPVRVSRTLITFDQWERCVAAGGCRGYRPDRQGWPGDAPVVNVSFDDALSYAAWLARVSGEPYRLLSESEWHDLARGTRTTRYPWGNDARAGQANCLDCGSRWDGRSSNPVGAFPPDQAGVRDALGNAANWTAPDHIAPGQCAAKPGYAAVLGASWADPAKYLIDPEATCFPKVLRDDTIGFRVAVSTSQ